MAGLSGLGRFAQVLGFLWQLVETVVKRLQFVLAKIFHQGPATRILVIMRTMAAAAVAVTFLGADALHIFVNICGQTNFGAKVFQVLFQRFKPQHVLDIQFSIRADDVPIPP